MASFHDVYDYVLPEIRGVEPETVDFLTRQIGRDFLKATGLWREVINLVLSPGMVDYKLIPRAGGQVAGIKAVGDGNGGRNLPNLDEGNRRSQGAIVDPGQPSGWWSLYPGIISFNRPPDVGYTLPIEVYKQLTLDPEDLLLPDFLFDNHIETLAFGIKARLHAMPSKPWTDTTMASVNTGLYQRAKLATRARTRDGGANAHSRVVAPLFAGR